MNVIAKLRAWRQTLARSGGVFMRDVGAGLLEVSHNSLALLGLAVVAAALFAGSRADMRAMLEQHYAGKKGCGNEIVLALDLALAGALFRAGI